jgi:sugar phosphate isomerase/epimerase
VPAAKVALSTASAYPETCVDAFAMAADLGYDGVEVMVWPDPVTQDAAALTRLADHYSMPVLAVHAPTLLVTQRVWGRDPWTKVERSCDLAQRLGASTVVVHPPFRWQRDYAAGFVAGVAELSARTGVRLAVENMYPWRARGREVLAYLPGWDPVPQPYADVTLDLSHTATAGGDALTMARALAGRLAHLHLADGVGSAKDEHLVPGRGSQPCGAVLGYLAEGGFDGVVVVEVNTRRCQTRSAREADLAESLAFARLHLAAPAAAEGRVPGAPPLGPDRYDALWVDDPDDAESLAFVIGADGEIVVTAERWPWP